MMESLVENFKTGMMIRSNADQKNYHRERENDPRHVLSSAGIEFVLENDAQREREVPLDQFKLNIHLSLEWQLEKVFKMNNGNLKKFLFLDIVIADECSDSNRVPQAWYCIDLSKMLCEGNDWVVWKVDPKLIVRKMPQKSTSPRMCVALGSVIYIFGGVGNNYHEQRVVRVYYLDTSNPKNEWLEGPSMNVDGEVGSAVIHEGKIYVFGSFVEYTGNNPCTGKVYDPVLNSWEPLGDFMIKQRKWEEETEEETEEESEDKFSYFPIKLHQMQGKFVGSYDDRKILVHPCLSEGLYAYDIVDKSWKVLDDRFGSWDCRGVIMDDVLYVFHQFSGEMCGYDLVQFKWLKPINLDQWFPRIVNSEGDEIFHEVFFFEVEANVLCMVYFNPLGEEGLDIYCRTFTIKKIMQEDGDIVLEAEVFSSTIYKVGKRGRCLDYVVM